MTLSYVYNKISKVMDLLESVDCNAVDSGRRTRNQKSIHNAYFTLDALKDDLIRERIRSKQKNKG